MMTTTHTLRRVLDWVDRLSVWNDETLNEFLQEVYGFEAAQGYLNEKREKLKRSVFGWFAQLDQTNQERFNDLLNNQSPDQWWLNKSNYMENR